MDDYYRLRSDLEISRVSQEMEKQTMELRASSLLELKALTNRVDNLDTVLQTQTQYQEVSRVIQDVSFALVDFETGLETRQSLTKPFELIQKSILDSADPVLQAAISSIPLSVISSGVASKRDLIFRFNEKVESALTEASLVPSSRSIWGYLLAKISKHFILKQHELVVGNGDISHIQRAGYYIDNGQFLPALKELESLSELPASVGEDFVREMRERMILEQALRMIQSHITIMAKSWQLE